MNVLNSGQFMNAINIDCGINIGNRTVRKHPKKSDKCNKQSNLELWMQKRDISFVRYTLKMSLMMF